MRTVWRIDGSHEIVVHGGHGIVQRQIRERSSSIIFRISAVEPTFRQRGHLAHVGVADDAVQTPVFLRVGVRLVARVDDGPLQRGLQADLGLEEVGPLGELVHDPAGVRVRASPRRPACRRR